MKTKTKTKSSSPPSFLPVIRVEGAVLPDLKGWTNRFEIKSESSSNIYIVSQNIEKRHWGCSCMGWIRYRKCKHLAALDLPAFERPKEVKIVSV